jgi:uncharacterized membrane protein YraQ (UPF0718 family)
MECCDKNNNSDDKHCHDNKKFDLILHGSLTIIILALIINFTSIPLGHLSTFSVAVTDLLMSMWWGLALGILAIGIMSYIPQEYIQSILGRGDSIQGIFRAALAGLCLDLCSHGILMVGAKLYEKGASLAQVITFLIASPWNSFSLTLILFSLIGFKWTFLFIIASLIIAVITGILYMKLVEQKILPSNHNYKPQNTNLNVKADLKNKIKDIKLSKNLLIKLFINGWKDGRMIIRWLFFGTILASLIKAFIPTSFMHEYFGPTILGLFLTLIATTVIEVCSEGSAPIGADLLNRAHAPGNSFTFLMAGVSTDYTEILVLREFTKSLKIALFLPLLTIPQILILGYIMNVFAT